MLEGGGGGTLGYDTFWPAKGHCAALMVRPRTGLRVALSDPPLRRGHLDFPGLPRLQRVGAAAFDQLFDSVVTGGCVALLSLPAKPTLVDWSKVIFKQLTLKGIYGREMFETCQKIAAMLESQLDLRKVITRRLPASRFLQGFETMRRGDGSGHGAEKREANFSESWY